jgi:hypothetical protein
MGERWVSNLLSYALRLRECKNKVIEHFTKSHFKLSLLPLIKTFVNLARMLFFAASFQLFLIPIIFPTWKNLKHL